MATAACVSISGRSRGKHRLRGRCGRLTGSVCQGGRRGPYRQASTPPTRHHPGARSARLERHPHQSGQDEPRLDLHCKAALHECSKLLGRFVAQLRQCLPNHFDVGHVDRALKERNPGALGLTWRPAVHETQAASSASGTRSICSSAQHTMSQTPSCSSLTASSRAGTAASAASPISPKVPAASGSRTHLRRGGLRPFFLRRLHLRN